MCTKTSLLLLYLRVFWVHEYVRVSCYATLGIVVLWSVASILATMFQCIPVQAAWDEAITSKVCINSNAQWYQYGIINIITDVMILSLPVREVLRLHTSKSEKYGLLVTFLVGSMYVPTPIFPSPEALRTYRVFTSYPVSY